MSKPRAKCPYCGREIIVSRPTPAEESSGARSVCPLCHHPFLVFADETHRMMQQTPEMLSIALEEAGDCFIEVVESQLADVQRYPLPRGTERSFGRYQSGSDVDMQLPTRDADLDRRHALFTHDRRGRLFVQDAGSSKGTYVNGIRLDPRDRHRLEDGDVISMGRTTVIVSTGDEG